MRKEFLRNIEGGKPTEKASDATIKGYRDLAKTSLETDETETLEADLDQRIAFAALARKTPESTQRAVFDLQVQKQKIMQDLKDALRRIDHPDSMAPERTPNSRMILYENGRYFRPGKYKADTITLGEIMTGASWGIDFILDPQSVPRDVRKRFIVERAKQRIQDLLDQQIIAEESTSKLTHEWKQGAYLAIKENKEQGFDQRRAGLLAEKMVKNLLLTTMHDFPVDYSISEADVYQDVEQKIDFIVRVNTQQRGVGIEKDARKAEVKGIQFTIQSSQEALHKKEVQIERARRQLGEGINDVVLVHIPLNHVSNMYEEWLRLKRPAGGPEKLWSGQTKERIFRGIMQGILSPEQINEHLARFRNETSIGKKAA